MKRATVEAGENEVVTPVAKTSNCAINTPVGCQLIMIGEVVLWGYAPRKLADQSLGSESYSGFAIPIRTCRFCLIQICGCSGRIVYMSDSIEAMYLWRPDIAAARGLLVEYTTLLADDFNPSKVVAPEISTSVQDVVSR